MGSGPVRSILANHVHGPCANPPEHHPCADVFEQGLWKSQAAIDFYTTVFRDTRIGDIARYGKDAAPHREGTLQYASFALEGQWFAAMDSAHEPAFAFNEAVSFVVNCDDQGELDHYWHRLSAVPQAEECGWLKD